MPAVADLGVDVEVVEEHELPRERVGVRRDVVPEQAQRRVRVALVHVAEDLVEDLRRLIKRLERQPEAMADSPRTGFHH